MHPPVVMSDEQMLLAAARHADIRILRSRMADPLHHDMLLVESINGQAVGWNPLYSLGDALALAIRRCMVVQIWESTSETTAICAGFFAAENHGDNAQLATCRAIVRAAAKEGPFYVR